MCPARVRADCVRKLLPDPRSRVLEHLHCSALMRVCWRKNE